MKASVARLRGHLAERAFEWGLALLVVALAAVAYRALTGFDPDAGLPRGLEGTEELLFEPSTSAPPLIYAITLWLLWRRWPRIRPTLGARPQHLGAALFLVPSVALCVWANYVEMPTLLIASLSLGLLGTALWLGGVAALRPVWLPAVFLLFAIPVPTAIVNQLMYPLQLATADTVTSLLSIAGLSIVSHGDRIFYDRTVFQVIESCSGLRSILTILMASVVYQELFYRSRLQSAAIVLAAPFVGLLVNQVRVITIVLNPYSQFAAVHTAQGLAMIVVGVFMLAGVDAILSRFLADRPRPELADDLTPLLPQARVAALGAMLAVLAAATLWLEPWKPPEQRYTPLFTLPAALDGWTASGLKLNKEFLGSVTFNEWVHRSYTREQDRVDVLLGADFRLHARTNLLSPKTAIPASGWVLGERAQKRLRGDGTAVESFVTRSPRNEALVYRWHYGVESPWVETLRSVLALDRGPLRRTERAVVVRLVTPLGRAPGTRAAADARLQDFAVLLQSELAELLIAPEDP